MPHLPIRMSMLQKYQDDVQRVQGAYGARSGATPSFNALIQNASSILPPPLLLLMQAQGKRLDRHEQTRTICHDDHPEQLEGGSIEMMNVVEARKSFSDVMARVLTRSSAWW